MKKLFVLAMLACFSFSANAAQFDTPIGKMDIYASIRAFTMYNDISIDQDKSGNRDFSDLKTRLQTNSRFGAKFDNGKLYGQVEFDGASDTGLRLLFAGYKLENKGKVQIGQFSSISDNKGYANRVLDSDGALVGFGALNDSRRAGIGYYKDGFSVQLTTLSQDDNHKGLIKGAEYEDVRLKELLPKLELAYQIKDFKVMGAFARYNASAWDNVKNTDEDFDANAYHIAFGYMPKFDNLTVKVSGIYAVNAGLYSMARNSNGKGGVSNLLPVVDSNNDVEDVTTYGGTFALNYKVNSQVSTEFGIGYQVSDSDVWEKDDANMAVYFNAPITVFKGFRVTPEIGYLDFMKDKNDKKDAKVLQAGVQLRIDL